MSPRPPDGYMPITRVSASGVRTEEQAPYWNLSQEESDRINRRLWWLGVRERVEQALWILGWSLFGIYVGGGTLLVTILAWRWWLNG